MKNSFFTSTLLRTTVLLALVAVLGSNLLAQNARVAALPKRSAPVAGNAEVAPAIANPMMANRTNLSEVQMTANKAAAPTGTQGTMGTQAMWDVIDILKLDSAASANVGGIDAADVIVGIAATNTEIWCSVWNSSGATAASGKIIRFTKTGSWIATHTVSTVGFTHGGFRALTFDGTYMWGAISGSNNLRAIDTATQTVVGIIATNAAISGGIRWATYDPSANSGAGGFWVGNFDTDIKLVTKPAFTPTPNPTTAVTGAVLTTITAATHGLTAMYGAVYDGTSQNGPYLWVNNQEDPFTGSSSGAMIVQVKLPSGATQPVYHDVEPDLAVTAGFSVAGGISIFNVPGSTRPVIASLYQGTGEAVLYDLDFVYTQIYDVAASKIATSNGLTGWPFSHGSTVDFNLTVRNGGNQALTSIVDTTFVFDLIAQADADTLSGTTSNLAISTSTTVTRGPFTATAEGAFVTFSIAQTANDVANANDTTVGFFALTDTFFSRDDFDLFGFQSSLGIGAGAAEEGQLGQVFTVTIDDTMSSVTGIFVPDSTDAAWDPSNPDKVSFSIYSVTSTGVPDQLLSFTTEYEWQVGDATDGVLVTLPLQLPVELTAGTSFAVVANEGAVNCGLFTTTNIYTPGKHFVRWNSNNGGAFTSLEAFSAGLRRAFVLRPNFGKVCAPLAVDLATISTVSNATCSGDDGAISLDLSDAAFNGASVTWDNGSTGATLTNVPAGFYPFSVTLADGCVYVGDATVLSNNIALLSDPANGNPDSHIVIDNSSTTAPASGSITCVVTNGTAPYSYLWNTGATTQTISGLDKGVYSVTVEDANECVGQFSMTITTATSIEDLKNAGISNMTIAPNPSNGAFALNVELLNNSNVSVDVLDANSKVVYHASETGSFSRSLNLDIAAGIYIVKVTTNSGVATSRIVVK